LTPLVPSESILPSFSELPTTKTYKRTRKPSKKRTRAPSKNLTRVPTAVPTKMPTSSETASQTMYSLATSPHRDLSSFFLTITLSINKERRLSSQHLESGTDELISLTESHLKTYIQDALSINVVEVLLKSLSVESSKSYLMEQFEGRIYFEEKYILPTQSSLDFLVEQAFNGDAVGAFLLLLQNSAKSPPLQNAIFANIEFDNENVAEAPLEKTFFGDFEWTTPWIVIVAAGCISLLACLLIVILICKANVRNSYPSPDAEKKTLAGTPRTHADDSFVGFEDSAVSDIESDTHSVYSYKHQDDASISLAPSLLHAIHERAALGSFYAGSDDDSMQSPSVFWNQKGASVDEKNNALRPKSVIVISSLGIKTDSTADNPNEGNNPSTETSSILSDKSCEKSHVVEDDPSAVDSVPEEESVAGYSEILNMTDDDMVKRKDFSHVWDNEVQKLDVTSFPDGDLSFEDDVISNP
jgi:hypothetical protein